MDAIMQYLVEKCQLAINEKDSAGDTPLHKATLLKDLQLVGWMVYMGLLTLP